jgi:fermentation-respiration switch protein FrsA (DUF1100 family)
LSNRALVLLPALLAASCAVNVDRSSLLPTMPEPVEQRVAPLTGYSREDRVLNLAGLGDVHVARLTRPGNTATVIYSGGSGSFISTSGHRLNEMAEVTGADIVTFDYSGRGGTTLPNTSEALSAFGPAFASRLRAEGWIAGNRLYAYGFSFGGASAATIGRSGGFNGLIFEGTAADIPAIVRGMVPSIGRPFVKVHIADDLMSFDYFGYTVAAKAPVLVLAGSNDKVIKADTSRRFAEDLRASGLSVTFIEVSGGHGQALADERGRKAVQQFLKGTAMITEKVGD